MRLFCCFVMPKLNMLPIALDSCFPCFTGTVKAHSFIARCIIFLSNPIPHVLLVCGCTKVLFAVVAFNIVNVIDTILRPVAVDIEPGEPVRRIKNCVNPDVNVSILTNVSGDISREFPALLNLPAKHPSFFVVGELLPKSCCCDSALRHCCLPCRYDVF